VSVNLLPQSGKAFGREVRQKQPYVCMHPEPWLHSGVRLFPHCPYRPHQRELAAPYLKTHCLLIDTQT
jgi:hypothetical protein